MAVLRDDFGHMGRKFIDGMMIRICQPHEIRYMLCHTESDAVVCYHAGCVVSNPSHVLHCIKAVKPVWSE